MKRIFTREQEHLQEAILRLAGEVESRLSMVLRNFALRSTEDLRTLIELDCEIDEREVQIEEECLKILALHQPVAKDLRYVVAVLKINNDLERIGDSVVNIAARGVRLIQFPVLPMQEKLMEMGRQARAMLRQSIDAFVTLDVAKAVEVIRRDDGVDTLKAEVMKEVVDKVSQKQCVDEAEALVLVHSMARDIERIGDHATNIAEDVAYLVDGTIIRHDKSKR